MNNIKVSKPVLKFLKKHPDVAEVFIQKAQLLSKNPLDPNADCKQMKAMIGSVRRLRIGKFRFLYEIQYDDEIIFFFHAGSRGAVYNKRAK